MPLLLHPDGGRLLRVGSLLAQGDGCCRPCCLLQCLVGRDAEATVASMANRTPNVCTTPDCTALNTTYLVSDLPYRDAPNVGALCDLEKVETDVVRACDGSREWNIFFDITYTSTDVLAIEFQLNTAASLDSVRWRKLVSGKSAAMTFIRDELCAGNPIDLPLLDGTDIYCDATSSTCSITIL